MPEAWDQLAFESQSSAVQPGDLALEAIRGRAELSTPYAYDLTLTCDQQRAPDRDALEAMLGERCVARWGPDGHQELHGLLAWIRVESIVDPTRVRFTARLVPQLARLDLAVRSRVFQDMDVLDVTRAVLEEHGLRDPGLLHVRAAGTYPKSEYTVQYQESDLAFVRRLLEHHGLFYYFTQEPDGEHLIVADANAAFTEYDGGRPVSYDPRSVASSIDTEGIDAWTQRFRVGHATVLLTEYNWRTPSVPLSNQAQADAVTGYGLLHRHGEHYKTPGDGHALAAVRAEQLATERATFEGAGRLYELHPGHVFEVAGLPPPMVDGRYAVTWVELEVAAGDEPALVQRFGAIEAEVPYRPPLRTPKPKIAGLMHGRIDGPAHSTAAPIDEHGRYKVLLPFDLHGQPGGRASRWIRVAQPSSGPGYGVHLPMHIGAEVAIGHLGGDPDRPVIVGSLHNAEAPNPVVTDNATQSAIRTQAGIRVLFDDDV